MGSALANENNVNAGQRWQYSVIGTVPSSAASWKFHMATLTGI